MIAPAMFSIRTIGKTVVTSTQETKIASDGLKSHVFEVSLTDLQNNGTEFRKLLRMSHGIILPMTKCAPGSKNDRP